MPRILIAGIGNIFLGDDAFGVEVAQRLLDGASCRTGVRVVDFGIRGLDLTYALLDGVRGGHSGGCDRSGRAPGTLYLVEPTVDSPRETDENGSTIDAHGMDPVKVLRLAARMGGRAQYVLLVGCEISPPVDPDEFQDGLRRRSRWPWTRQCPGSCHWSRGFSAASASRPTLTKSSL